MKPSVLNRWAAAKTTRARAGRVFRLIIAPLIVGLIVLVIQNHLLRNKASLEVSYAVTDTTPYSRDTLGGLHLKYDTDAKINRYELSVNGIGSEAVKAVEVDVRSMRSDLLLPPEPVIVYEPPVIEERVAKREISRTRLYLHLSELPAGTGVHLQVDFPGHFAEGDLSVAVLGGGRNWPPIKQRVALRPAAPSFWRYLFGKVPSSSRYAYAQGAGGAPEPKGPRPSKGGVYIGGYDPVVLTAEIFEILQRHQIVDKSETESIKRAAEEVKSGVGFGGIDVLRFDEVVLNILIRKGILDRREAEAALERARHAGGVLVNGYNVIHLKAEILNALLAKRLITLPEAQGALDKSKAP